MAIDVAQIQEWREKAAKWDALQTALGGNEVGNGRGRGTPRSKRGPSRKGAKSLSTSTAKRWAKADALFKAGKIKKKDLKLAAAYEAKHSSE